jgi:hypothetical protein
MLRRRSERGEGQGGCIVGVLILLVVVYSAIKLVPIKVRAAEMRQTVIDEAKSAGTHNDKRIRRAIMEKSRELELPLNEKDLEINRKVSEIRVAVKYTVPVQFPGFTYKWNFEHVAENPIF